MHYVRSTIHLIYTSRITPFTSCATRKRELIPFLCTSHIVCAHNQTKHTQCTLCDCANTHDELATHYVSSSCHTRSPHTCCECTITLVALLIRNVVLTNHVSTKGLPNICPSWRLLQSHRLWRRRHFYCPGRGGAGDVLSAASLSSASRV